MKSSLIIKDLPVSAELSSRAMSAVRGGSAVSIVGGNFQTVAGGGGFLTSTTGTQTGPSVTTADISSHLRLNLLQASNFGGTQLTAV
ncbi:hypothetical protein [Paraburkholderia sp.]|uniref:hypothetical protein n=1 Tax=Paraburkholderia sp. TaxID=1926495 RepID=UPI002384B366|nr:hypothetical protein [Paraburkholderia sp.]MDE1182677.1 hypothetical protein [Paraburkholderia sp.]